LPHQPILGLNRIELPPCPLGCVLSLLKLEFECTLEFVVFAGRIGGVLQRGLDRTRSDHRYNFTANCFIDAQTAEGYTGVGAVVDRSATAVVTRHLAAAA
jgi:hypothetical protein